MSQSAGTPVYLWTYAPEFSPDLSDSDKAADREAACDYLRSVGVDPNMCGPRCAVVDWEGRPELHVDEIAVIYGTNHCRTDPLDSKALLAFRRVIPVEAGSWPRLVGNY